MDHRKRMQEARDAFAAHMPIGSVGDADGPWWMDVIRHYDDKINDGKAATDCLDKNKAAFDAWREENKSLRERVAKLEKMLKRRRSIVSKAAEALEMATETYENIDKRERERDYR